MYVLDVFGATHLIVAAILTVLGGGAVARFDLETPEREFAVFGVVIVAFLWPIVWPFVVMVALTAAAHQLMRRQLDKNK
jgi:hypothetical protein